MNAKLFSNKIICITSITLLSFMCVATSQQPDPNSGHFNFYELQEGGQRLPDWHASITITDHMRGFLKEGMPQESNSPALTQAIIYVGQETLLATVFISKIDHNETFVDEEIDATSVLKDIKERIEKKYFSSQNNETSETRWFCEPQLNKKTKTIASAFKFIVGNKPIIHSISYKLGKYGCASFEWRVPEEEYKQLKEGVEVLINSFAFDPEYSLPDNVFDTKAIHFSPYLYIVLCFFLILILAFILSMLWRKNAKNGNQKIAAELLATFLIAILFNVFKVPNGSTLMTKSLPALLGLCFGESIGTSLLVFFIFFFWSWKKEFVQISPARTIIKALCIIAILLFVWFILENITGSLQSCMQLFNCVLFIILIVLIVKKYKQLFVLVPSSSQENVEYETK